MAIQWFGLIGAWRYGKNWTFSGWCGWRIIFHYVFLSISHILSFMFDFLFFIWCSSHRVYTTIHNNYYGTTFIFGFIPPHRCVSFSVPLKAGSCWIRWSFSVHSSIVFYDCKKQTYSYDFLRTARVHALLLSVSLKPTYIDFTLVIVIHMLAWSTSPSSLRTYLREGITSIATIYQQYTRTHLFAKDIISILAHKDQNKTKRKIIAWCITSSYVDYVAAT